MQRPARGRLIAALLLLGSAVVAPIVAVPSAAAAPVPPVTLLARLTDSVGGAARVDKVPGTDRIRFLGTSPGRPARRPAGISASAAPDVAARAFIKAYGRLFTGDDAVRELRLAKAPRTDAAGVRTVRFQQEQAGVPVLGGDLVVQLESDNDVVAAFGETTTAPATTTPAISAAKARATALAVIARNRKVTVSTLRASAPTLAVYDSRLLGAPGLDRATLVWRTEVTSVSGEEMRENVLIDAVGGTVALSFDALPHAKEILVCDNKGLVAPTDACSAPDPAAATSPVRDVRDAYRLAADTYDFYLSHFGRKSVDGADLPLKSVVRFCPDAAECPFDNAYWNGTHVVYGAGLASADDVVGHELSHGFTEHESGLFYLYQSGAINESLSDVFGELIDQDNVTVGDTAAAKWEIGEDAPGGALRSMKDPTIFGDPDRMTSSLYSDETAFTSGWDEGGVHRNSGVNNKAAYLITDGGTFNGRTVTGLGRTKAARLYYDAALMLTSASDYRMLYNVLQQACATAAGGGIDGMTAGNCAEVKKALDAVEMGVARPRRQGPVFRPRCAAGQTLTMKFQDDLENTASGNWARTSYRDINHDGVYWSNRTAFGKWYFSGEPGPYQGWEPTFATSGRTNLWGDDSESSVDSRITRTASVSIAGGSYLQFNHSYLFDHIGADFYDAGAVEYSTDNGTTWSQVPSTWIKSSGYNGRVHKDTRTHFDSMYAGQLAFVGDSKGYTTTRILLTELAGKAAKFRFRTSSDFVGSGYGWFVDDISVYDCAPYATSLTVKVSDTVIRAGDPVVIGGRLTYQGAVAGIPGRSIRLLRRPRGVTPAADWQTIATVTTSSTGTYRFTDRPAVNHEYSSQFAPTGPYLRAPYPGSPNVYVAPKLSATLSATSVPRTGTAMLSGSVAPWHAGRTVSLQRYVSGSWRGVTSTVLSSRSRYAFAIKPGARGVFKYRVIITAHLDHSAGKSATRALTVS